MSETNAVVAVVAVVRIGPPAVAAAQVSAQGKCVEAEPQLISPSPITREVRKLSFTEVRALRQANEGRIVDGDLAE
jgi:hypothetical protein